MAEPIDADALFALPLDEFTNARNALAKRLAAKGNDEQAAEVKALRKPSVTAWAVNQLAHTHTREVKRLVEATDRVRDASSAGELRVATDERTKILAQLVDEASEILDEAGRAASRAQLDKITQTLQTASASEELRDDLTAGRIRADLESSGFGEISAFAPTEETITIDRAASAAAKKAEELAKKADAAAERADHLEKVARDLEDQAASARDAADKARAAAEGARERADAAPD
jgi:signal transduction histidine kinase